MWFLVKRTDARASTICLINRITLQGFTVIRTKDIIFGITAPVTCRKTDADIYCAAYFSSVYTRHKKGYKMNTTNFRSRKYRLHIVLIFITVTTIQNNRNVVYL